MSRSSSAGWSLAVAALVLYQSCNARTLLSADLNDFGRFWASSRAVLDSRSPYASAAGPTSGPAIDRNLNPPPVVYLLAPLGWLSPHVALAVWAALGLSAMVAVLWLTIQSRPSRAGPVVCLALGLAATGAILKTGQIVFLLALPMALSWRAMREERAGSAGAWLGIVLAARPFLVLFPFVWILRRGYRASFAALAVAGSIHIACVAVAGVAPYKEWWALLRSVDWFGIPLNMSAMGFASRIWGSGHSPFAPILAAPEYVGFSVGLCALGLLTYLFRRISRKSEPDRDYVAIGLVALVLSPIGWAYYLWLIVPALCVTVVDWLHVADSRSDRAIAATLLLCIPVPLLTEGQPNGWLTLTLGSAYLWGVLLVLLNETIEPALHRSVRLR